jgi:hypothetical protein
MTLLHDKISRVLDFEKSQAENEKARGVGISLGASHRLVCVEADHRVLTRHAAIGKWCAWCYDVEDKQEFGETPCPDLLDLAARRGVAPPEPHP